MGKSKYENVKRRTTLSEFDKKNIDRANSSLKQLFSLQKVKYLIELYKNVNILKEIKRTDINNNESIADKIFTTQILAQIMNYDNKYDLSQLCLIILENEINKLEDNQFNKIIFKLLDKKSLHENSLFVKEVSKHELKISKGISNLNLNNDYFEFLETVLDLKKIPRTGWLNWKVKSPRIENVAEHTVLSECLALSINHIFRYNLDLAKLIPMLLNHELGESVIGDFTAWDISKSDKLRLEKEAYLNLVDKLDNKESIIELYDVFEDRTTKLGLFGHMCDKLECDLQSKIYDQRKLVDLNNQESNKSFNDPLVQQLLKEEDSWSNMWMEFGLRKYPYDENFKAISNYVKKHGIK